MRVRADGRRVAALVARAAASALAAAALAFLAVAPAEAAACRGGDERPGEAWAVWGECTSRTPGRPPSADQRRLWESYCGHSTQASVWGGAWRDVPGRDEVVFHRVGPLGDAAEYEWFGYDPTGTYTWFDVMCIYRFPDGAWDWVDYGSVLWESSAPVPIEEVVDRAKAKIRPPAPSPASAPPLDDVIVKARTWLWLAGYPWRPIAESESQGAVTVNVVATPARVVWEMGDSGLATCHGPGTPWAPGAAAAAADCHYTFVDSSAIMPTGVFNGTVTVVFDVEWWLDDPWSAGRRMGGAGTVERSAAFAVDVDEIQALETDG